MLQQNDGSRFGIVLGVGCIALAAAAALGPRAAHSRSAQPGVDYEYAELTIRGNDAILQTADRTIYLEGPDTNNPQQAENKRSIRVFREVALIHLNTVGASGWDVTWRSHSGGNDSFLLQRAR